MTAIVIAIILISWNLNKRIREEARHYKQIGDTCGFYALVYAVSKVTDIDKKQVVKQLIMENIENGMSNVGEVFDIDLLQSIAKNYFPNVYTEVIEFGDASDLDKLLFNGEIIIFPHLHGNIPHYCVIEDVIGDEYVYRHNDFAEYERESKDVLLGKNKSLAQYGEFCWKHYYDKKVGFRFFDKLCTDKVQKLSDKELLLFFKRNRRKKKAKLYDSSSNINMANKVLTIAARSTITHQDIKLD